MWMDPVFGLRGVLHGLQCQERGYIGPDRGNLVLHRLYCLPDTPCQSRGINKPRFSRIVPDQEQKLQAEYLGVDIFQIHVEHTLT